MDVLVDVVDVVGVVAHTDVDTDPGDRWNMLWPYCLTVSDSTQCTPQSIRRKAFASPNMNPISVTRATFHLEMSTLKDSALRNMLRMSVTCATFHSEMSALKKDASLNIPCMLATDETFHLEMSALKKGVSLKIPCMSTISEVSHFLIGPWSPLAQLPSDERSRHAVIAWLRSHLSSGKNIGVSADGL